MFKPNLNEFNKNTIHISHAANKFFGQQVPHYVKSLPSIKKDTKRWACNILYFGLGLMFNWAVSAVLRQIPNMHQFPSNVAGMIVLFFLLMCSHTVMPKHTDRFVQFVDPYSSFALRSMNIMFVPAVVQIVNNPPTTGAEVGRMICVFRKYPRIDYIGYYLIIFLISFFIVVGYVVGFIICTLLVRLLHVILFREEHKKSAVLSEKTSGGGELTEVHRNRTLHEEVVSMDLPDSAHLDQTTPPTVITIPTPQENYAPSENDVASSCASTLTNISTASIQPTSCNDDTRFCSSNPDTVYEAYQPRQKHGPLHYFAVWCMQQSSFDDLTLFIIFCLCAFVFLPLPEDNPAMPFFRLFLYFSMTILLYSASCRLPAKARVVIHPIILTSACVMAGIAYFERVKGFDIYYGVNLYKTGITFISLVERTNVGWPGAGDIFAAAMDVAIISMAFNVYKTRPDSLREVSSEVHLYLFYLNLKFYHFLKVVHCVHVRHPHGFSSHVCHTSFCTLYRLLTRR